MMSALGPLHLACVAYGSIARGDVTDTSDIDVYIPMPPAPTIIETALERAGLQVLEREIIQATPSYAAKGYIEVGERRSFSFPLVRLRAVESDFYRFAGSVDTEQVRRKERVKGVDKRLMLIEPTPLGHIENPIIGFEGKVAMLLGVGVEVVRDRVRTLTRRDKVGRTGVFVKRVLSPDEGFGDAFRRLSLEKPATRRRMRKKT